MNEHPASPRLSRRAALQAGAALFPALTLPGLLRLQAASVKRADTTVILVYMAGGPSQFETYDPKPDAPREYRGDHGSIPTNVPGVHFCDLLPRQAKLMDQLAIVRSVHHEQASHIAEHIIETGYDLKSNANIRKGEMPGVGSIVSKLRGPSPGGIPAYVKLRFNPAYSGPHWLGEQHRYFGVKEDPNEPDFDIQNLALTPGLNLARLENRKTLSQELDQQRRAYELQEDAGTLDAFAAQAFKLVAGDAARNAFDLGREAAATRAAYGRNSFGQRMLLARRLAEAGVPYVVVRTSDWDDHKDMPKRIRARVPDFDQAMAALITDLRERGLNRKVLVVALGEFGRTPRINKDGGRDHWPSAQCALFAGGDYRMGQVIGATDRIGGTPADAPYRPQNVLAMIYRHLGIDPAVTFNDFTGRPRYALEERRLITELI